MAGASASWASQVAAAALTLCLSSGVGWPNAATAGISYDAFGPRGEGGEANGQRFSLGPAGSVHELDLYLHVDGVDLNGAAVGTAAQLSRDVLPPGLDHAFSALLSPDAATLTLTYELTNASGADLAGVSLLPYFDAEIDEPRNTFFDEYAVTSGAPAPDQGYSVSEPGFASGALQRNLLSGALDGANGVPADEPDDVAMAFRFHFPRVEPFDVLALEVAISENGTSIGDFAITQRDADPDAPPTEVTYSARATLIPGDLDEDGVPDRDDQCLGSDVRPTVVLEECDSLVANTIFDDGCTLADRVLACSTEVTVHGEFVSCVAHVTNEMVARKEIRGAQKGAIQRCAAQTGP